jgi:hypothetical protein
MRVDALTQSAPSALDVLSAGWLVDVAVRGLALLQAEAGLAWASLLVAFAVLDVEHAVLLVHGTVERLPAFKAEGRNEWATSWLDALQVSDVDHLKWLVDAAMRLLTPRNPKGCLELAAGVLAALASHVDHIGVLVYLAPRRLASYGSETGPPPRTTLDVAK